ncbi:MAG: hypothetical protein HGA75_09700 [Thiobacillus sp.]|nr:hypothetical protein [Thiobacillus sp.]
MADDSLRDSLTEWFHELAKLSEEELRAEASPENIDMLRLHIERSVPAYALPAEISKDEFAESVQEFRRNESSWNRAVMASLVKAGDLFNEGLAYEAVDELHRFAASCPWALFQEVALNQAALYES